MADYKDPVVLVYVMFFFNVYNSRQHLKKKKRKSINNSETEHSLAGCLLRALNNMANIQYVIDLK